MANTVSALTKDENGTITLQIQIPWKEVNLARESVLDEFSKEMAIQGFRKGKAPKNVVMEHVDPERLREETLKKVLPNFYTAAVKEHKLTPIINPKIHVDKLEDGNDWTFTAITCEMPEIKLGDYKKKITAMTAKSKIILPAGSEAVSGQETTGPNFDEMMQVILGAAELTVPPMLAEQEVDRLLSQTLDEIKKLGLTLEQYLASTKKTPEQLREDYRAKAMSDIKMEFVLQKIADDENITVEDREIDEAILKAPNPQEKTYLEQNRYLLASILRQQKTLDFLKNL